MKYIKFFSEIDENDRLTLGGKTTSLGELSRAGIPVPNGFGVSIEAHRKFLNTPFDEEFESEIKDALTKLKASRVAVRSSAIAEDGANASWAGQLETYLNVNPTPRDVAKAIKKCWDSINADHVKEYAMDKSLDEDSLLVGVTVQTMVDSDISGVMFTVNPVTNNDQEILIEGSYGLGETVVQGIVSPDNFIVNKKTLQPTEFDIKIKKTMMKYINGKNKFIDVPADISDRSIMREAEVSQLASLSLLVESYFNYPQDIEWAKSNDKFYIIQARPITTLTESSSR